MSRLLESSLTGKISNILVESDIQGQMLSKELEREVPCLRKLIYKDGSELKYALDGDLDKECEKKIYDIAKSRGFDCDIDIDGAYVFITYSESNVNECDEPKEVKPTEKTREELIRDHGTDDVDLINAGKEPEERVALKETEGFVNEIDAIADFMIDFDTYGFEESYDGDADAKRDQLIQDITRDRKTVAYYLHDVVVEGLGTEEQQAEAKRLLGSADLEKYIKTNESMSDEDLERVMDGTMDDYSYSTIKAKEEADKKKAIEDRIAELRLAIEDGVSEDEKADMEKEIAELENQLNESSLNEDITVITPENEKEARKYLTALYQSKSDYESDRKYHHGYTKSEYQFQKSEIKRIEKLLKDYEKGLKSESALSEGEDSQGALKAFSDGLTEAIRLQELRNAEAMGEFFQEAMGILRSVAEENGYMVEGAKAKKLTEDSYEKGIFKDIEDALVDAGFNVDRYIDAGVLTKNIGWEVSKNGKHTQLDCPGSWYDEDEDDDDYYEEDKLEESSFETPCVDDGSELAKKYNLRVISNKNEYDPTTPFTCTFTGNRQDIENMIKTEFNTGDEELNKKIISGIKESVSVATTDGSTVDTQDAASVQSNDGTVTVVTGDTTVVINNTPTEPALDIPVEEPIEEVPTEEIIDEPVEEIPAEEVPVEEPVEDEVIEESDDEYGIDANVDAKSLAVLKNQGITYMLQIEETSGKTTYWVCDNFNAETNEGDNAEVFTEKEKADEEYFKRVGLEPTVEEE